MHPMFVRRYAMFRYDGCYSSRTVQTIGDNAFQNCRSLNSATISE